MSAGRKPGTPKTGGRIKGTPNKATYDLKALAQQYTEPALKELARLALNGKTEPARVAAIKELFDRGYGKARQPLEHSLDNSFEQLLDRIANRS